MSADLYLIRLFFEWFSGIMKKWGRSIHITTCPQFLRGKRLISVDYAPEVGTAELQEYAGPRREMYPNEILAANEFLDELKDK